LLKNAYYVGLKHDELMRMTLNEFNIFVDAFIDRRKDENKLADQRTARICCIIANINSKKKFKESDFMPKEKGKQLTPDQFASMLRIITGCCGGEING